MRIYDDSKTFIVNSEIEAVVADIKSILKKSVPYSEIFQLPDLLEKFINLYSGLLNEMQKPIDTAIQEARQRVFEELQDKKCFGFCLALGVLFVCLFVFVAVVVFVCVFVFLDHSCSLKLKDRS